MTQFIPGENIGTGHGEPVLMHPEKNPCEIIVSVVRVFNVDTLLSFIQYALPIFMQFIAIINDNQNEIEM